MLSRSLGDKSAMMQNRNGYVNGNDTARLSENLGLEVKDASRSYSGANSTHSLSNSGSFGSNGMWGVNGDSPHDLSRRVSFDSRRTSVDIGARDSASTASGAGCGRISLGFSPPRGPRRRASVWTPARVG